MLRAPVLMRSLRDRGDGKRPSIIKKGERSRTPSTATNGSFYNEENNRRGSRGSIQDSNSKPGSSRNDPTFKVETRFCIKICEIKGENEEAVYYKDDEDRFTQRYTLKLSTHTQYKVSIEVESEIKVQYLKIGGILWDQFLILPNPDDKSTKVDHVFMWRTDKMEITGNKYRTILPCAVKLQNQEEIKFVAMVKFYALGKMNHTKDAALSFLSLDDSGSSSEKRDPAIRKVLFN